MIEIIELGGKQYVVREGTRLIVDAAVGSKKELTLTGKLTGKKVVTKLGETHKTPKTIVYKMKPKTRYRRTKGNRALQQTIIVEKIQ